MEDLLRGEESITKEERGTDREVTKKEANLRGVGLAETNKVMMYR